jgi:hypothetical protein
LLVIPGATWSLKWPAGLRESGGTKPSEARMAEAPQKERREEITALGAKFKHLWERMKLPTETAFMEAIEKANPASKLKRREFARQITDGKMNSTYQRCLGEFAGFDWQGAAWKKGSLPDFITELDRGRSYTLLVEDDQYLDTKRIKTDFAMLTLFAPANAPETGPGEIHVSFTLNCPKLVDSGFQTGVVTCWLDFDLSTGRTTAAKNRKGFPGTTAEYNNARLTPHDLDFHKPSWLVDAVQGYPIGFVVDVPADFLKVSNLPPDTIIKATLRVYVGQLGISFVLPDGTAETAAKQKLKQRLKLLQILGDTDGKAVIATSAIKIKAKVAQTKDKSSAS